MRSRYESPPRTRTSSLNNMKDPLIANQLPVGTCLEEGTVDVSWVVDGGKREEPSILEERALLVL